MNAPQTSAHAIVDMAHAPPETLERMLNADAPSGWSDADLAAMLRHQLATPLAAELIPAGFADEPSLRAWSAGARTFRDLFAQPTPVPQLVDVVRRFSKAPRGGAAVPALDEIRTALYFSAIALALVRLRVRQTSLNSTQLAAGFAWCRARPWLDPALADLIAAAQTL